MNTRTFARLLAKTMNDHGIAAHAVAQKSKNGGWRIVDKTADIIIPSATCITPKYDNIHWLRSQEEYRVGKVDVFQATVWHNEAPCYFYVGPNGTLFD